METQALLCEEFRKPTDQLACNMIEHFSHHLGINAPSTIGTKSGLSRPLKECLLSWLRKIIVIDSTVLDSFSLRSKIATVRVIG